MRQFKSTFRSFFSVIILLSLAAITSAQETVVVGQVLNKADKTPIQKVNVCFKNSDKPTQSNDEGYFLIRYNGRESTLIFSCVGYKKQQIQQVDDHHTKKIKQLQTLPTERYWKN